MHYKLKWPKNKDILVRQIRLLEYSAMRFFDLTFVHGV